jgi:transcription initiation factor TFIIH subunit 1
VFKTTIVQLTNSHELAEVTPRHERDGVGQMLIDLDATEQDHPEVEFAHPTGHITNERPQSGNTQDLPMQAGRQKQAIPLIRRFNEHSERLLNSALGQEPLSKRQRMETEAIDDVSPQDSPSEYVSG